MRTTIILVTAILSLVTGCATREAALGADGYLYFKVTSDRNIGGGIVIREEWQRDGELGRGKPTYFKLMQSKDEVAPPIFTRSGSNF